MFKKPSEVKGLQRLSGADKKKLRRSVREKFVQATDADLDFILPPKAEITLSKHTNRVHVYAVEGGPPMIFDVDGRGNEVFPTVYALWKAPNLLPAFVLKGGEVSRYVLGGADLMFPGISIPSEGFPAFKAGELWSVKVPGNDFPIAVGTTITGSKEAMQAGFRGKALRITHYYHDTLWESAEGRHVPNAGFKEDIVVEDPSYAQECEGSGEAVELLVDAENQHEEFTDTGHSGTATELTSEQHIEDIDNELSVLKVNDVDNDIENGTSAGMAVTLEEMDALLDRCLLQALHTSVKDKDLPMPGSNLWSGHILPCRPPGSTLDIKKSTYKKLTKWLQAKSSLGLISAKEDKHRKEAMLISVNRLHPEYQGFRPEKLVSSEPAPAANTDVAQTNELQVVEVWKPTTHVNSIYEAMNADATKFYSAQEASEIVFAYVEKEKLVRGDNRAVIILDATLCDALYKGTVKRGSTYPTEIHKKDLAAAFLARMQAHHKVSRGSDSVVRRGALKCIQIMTERRQGNKKVTRVSGTESFLVDAEVMAAELQKKFACSTSVAELPGKKGQYEVLVQGGVLEDLAKHLLQHYGIPKKYIEILDKTKK